MYCKVDVAVHDYWMERSSKVLLKNARYTKDTRRYSATADDRPSIYPSSFCTSPASCASRKQSSASFRRRKFCVCAPDRSTVGLSCLFTKGTTFSLCDFNRLVAYILADDSPPFEDSDLPRTDHSVETLLHLWFVDRAAVSARIWQPGRMCRQCASIVVQIAAAQLGGCRVDGLSLGV